MRHLIEKVFLFSVLVIVFGCSSQTMKEKYGYKVSKWEDNKPIKITFYLELKEQLTEIQIKEIAAEYRQEYDKYMSVFIFYLLPGMEMGAGAWATSHYTPELKITIYGMTKAEEEELLSEIQPMEGAIGTWYCSAAGIEHKIVFIEQGDNLTAKLAFKDGSEKEEVLIRKPNNRFNIEGNKDGEYYILNEAGDLELWDTQGLFTTAKKVD